ncbi:hypothetical protein SAMN05216436_1282 [bacterium A37T11]|nr:hypothetical protein SAMN05216436_1282 [bacterium A37T11]
MCIICVAIVSKGLAQQNTTLKGGVFEQKTNLRISGATISNQKTGQTQLTDDRGLFSIKAQIGDTLRIFKEGYAENQVALTSLSDVIINLTPVIALDEVTVVGKNKNQEMQDIMNDYRKKGTFYNGKPPVLSYIFTPITALYELFGRTPRNARNFQKYMNNEVQQQVVDQKFNKEIVAQHTGLSGEDLTNFMAWYRPSFEKAQYWNEYDVIDYLQKSLAQFNKDKRPKAESLPKLEIPPQHK